VEFSAAGQVYSRRIISPDAAPGKGFVARGFPAELPAMNDLRLVRGIDPHKELFDGDQSVPITDGGKVIAELFS